MRTTLIRSKSILNVTVFSHRDRAFAINIFPKNIGLEHMNVPIENILSEGNRTKTDTIEKKLKENKTKVTHPS